MESLTRKTNVIQALSFYFLYRNLSTGDYLGFCDKSLSAFLLILIGLQQEGKMDQH